MKRHLTGCRFAPSVDYFVLVGVESIAKLHLVPVIVVKIEDGLIAHVMCLHEPGADLEIVADESDAPTRERVMAALLSHYLFLPDTYAQHEAKYDLSIS